MTDRHPGAFMLALSLHVAVAGLMWLVNYAATQSKPDTTKVFEMVAGEGDGFANTEAPALGSESPIKADVPVTPAPKPVEVTPAPPTPAPTLPVTPVPTPKPVPSIAKQIERKVVRADNKTKEALKKEHEAEAKRLTKKEFDEQNKNQKTVASAAPAKIPKVNVDGFAKGVAGGTGDKPGAGGKALTRPDGPVMDAYFSLLQERLRNALEKPPGLADTLVAVVEVYVNADGSLTRARIKKSSGSAEFDQAALAAVNSTRMPERPDKKSELISIPFRMKEVDEAP